MKAPAPEALRRGWCPSALRPMETGDGWLVRLHPPGAVLTPAQLSRIAGLAKEHGNGLVEISARANLQLRGVSLATHPELVATLLAERLVEEHDGDGPQRLTLVGPLVRLPFRGPHPEEPRSGVSKDEGSRGESLIDARALAESIELSGRAISGLPAKCLVIVDDGGPLSLDGFACDLRIVAVDREIVAIGLPDGRWLGPVAAARAAESVAGLLSAFAHRRQNTETIRRLRDLPARLLDAAVSATGLPPTTAPAMRPAPRRAGSVLSAHGEAALIGLPFGRADADTLQRLGEAALQAGASTVRLSPWRGLAFSGLEPAAAGPLLAVAAELGLIVDPDDPRLSIEACAGKPACLRANSNAMADAAALAEAAAPLLTTGANIHVSGCVKSCAHPGSSDITLVGREGGYDVIVAGTTRDEPVATLDLSAIMARLRPGQDLFTRLSGRGTLGPQV